MPAYSIRVTGKVQGVFFRASTQEKAQSLSIRGWVKNEPDGSVLIHAEGEEASVRRIIDWCHEGPPQADVKDIQVDEVSEEGLSSFKIDR